MFEVFEMPCSTRWPLLLYGIVCLLPALSYADDAASPAGTDDSKPVSFYRDIRPLLQTHCQGCHQPARAAGEYVMTSFDRLLTGGESGDAAIVPGDPDASPLVQLITPENGEAAMPKGKQPLHETEIALVRRWIAEGARDDTPDNARERYSVDNPPVYSRLPSVTSIDYSPDGSLIAAAGFHEVLLHKADGSGLVARLIGVSERIERVAFSPDGTRLAVAGGNPGRLGELQVWGLDGESGNWGLQLSVPVTFDTIYGASWSGDGKLIAVGCSDATVRAFDSTTGEQVFFNGAHEDWALDTVFSADGSHLVSVGRDMTTKLYEVATQRFVDNVTSITPGALKGGIGAVARHPQRDEVLVGGSDGTPRIYRMHRVTKRVIGDDANLIRRFPTMIGRIYGVAYSPDGKRIAAVSSLDGQGQLSIYSVEFDPAMPDDIKAIVQKTTPSQSAEEKKRLEEWITSGISLIAKVDLPVAPYAVDWSPDGTQIVTSGADGLLRFFDPHTATEQRQFAAVEIDAAAAQSRDAVASLLDLPEDRDGTVAEEPLPDVGVPALLLMQPRRLDLKGKGAYGQVHIVAWYTEGNGETFDVTRAANLVIEEGQDVATVTETGRVIAKQDGEAVLAATLGDQTARIRVNVTGFGESRPVSYIRDVNPVLTRLGCNQGTCHGANDGKNGFKLSLRGYDPLFDVRSFTDDLKSRRTNIASPDNSLMLLKATGAVPHVGGQLTRPGHPYYETIRQWIAEGARLDLDVPRVAAIAIQPQNPIIEKIGGRQQFAVYARYTDGEIRDVTREAFLESSNTEVAVVNRAAIASSVRRGEAAIMARFEGQYAATTLTVMGERDGFWQEWKEPESWNRIDTFVAAKWKRMKIVPSGVCSDDEFVRRVYLDLTGLPPSADQLRSFLADDRPTQEKRTALVDELIGSEAFVDYWTNKWADLLQVNRKFLGAEGARLFRDWIRQEVAQNTPYDEFAYKILTASGSNKLNPPASYYKILREPTEIMENTTHLFLGVRFNCNKCHDHPFERWNQDQYYETAAFFARTDLQRDPQNADGNIGGTAVEGAKPLWEVVVDRSEGEMTHVRTGAVAPPVVPYDRDIPVAEEASRREQLATWITSAENDYFARSYANRVWAYLIGVGLIEPIDDIRAGNPPTNPELLDYLTGEFVESDFNVRHLMRLICTSRTYQLSIETNQWNADDTLNYSHALPKRLPAEVLYDAVYSVTGAKMNIPGVPAGTRAAALPDVGVELKDNFLANLGRPVRESACECERSSELQLGPVMALMNGPTVSEAISQPGNGIEQLVSSEPDDEKLVNELFVRILSRSATKQEVAATLSLRQDLKSQHEELVAQLNAYREKIAPVVAEREEKRQKAIAAAEGALKSYAEEIRPREEAAEKSRQEKIAAAQQAIDRYVATIPEKLAAWEQTVASGETGWTILNPQDLKTSTGATLAREDDLSVFASGPNNKRGNYTLWATSDLARITGIKLEVFSDPRLPSNGPGRAPNGNFVLSEFTVEAAPAAAANRKKKVALQNAQANFSQQGYDVSTAIDGKAPQANNGWATHPKTGETRIATFELKEPLEIEGGAKLFFKLDQQYQGRDHTIGRFRISVTSAAPPLQPGLPKHVLEIVRTPQAERTEEQQAALIEHYKQIDSELQNLNKALADAQKPRPEDPRLVELRNKLEEVSRPLPTDPTLARYERAVELSAKQLENERLTMAQDLAWALINSPAFLFNR